MEKKISNLELCKGLLNNDRLPELLLEEAGEMNLNLKRLNIRENFPIQSQLSLYIHSHNVNNEILKKHNIRYEIKDEYHIFYLPYLVDSGCDIPVIRDSFCEILKS